MTTTAETLITEHLDIWSSTIKAKKTTGRGSKKKQELYGIKKLRELILELAVRGLLVPQDTNDEPANVLHDIITAEKKQLIKAGEIRTPKDLSAIKPTEIPFQAPPSWKWVRLGEIANTVRGVTYKKTDVSEAMAEGSIPLMRANNIGRGLNFNGLIFIPSNIVRADQIIVHGDVLIAMSSGSADLVGKAAQAKDDLHKTFGAFCGIIRSFSKTLFPYFDFFFQTPLYRDQTRKSGKGIGIQNLNQGALASLLIPLPPLAEQHRIVAKVDELMALCDQLEQQQEDSLQTHQTLVKTLLAALTTTSDPAQFQQAWQRIATNFDTLFTTEASIDQLKQTILQLAVMGKLVPQDPKDEPASALRIELETARLAKKTRLKKKDTLEKIPIEPISIPKHWERIQLNEICDLGGGMTPSKSKPEYWNGDINWFSSKDIKPDFLCESELKITEEGLSSTRLRLYPPGSLFIVARSGILKHTLPVSISKYPGTSNQDLKVLEPYIKDMELYLQIMFRGMNSFIIKHLVKTGMTVQSLKYYEFTAYSFPIPPIGEQHRIVDKVTELMTLCDQLKANLHKAQETQLSLTDTISHKAFSSSND